MRVVGLISGGKDSIYNMLQCIAAGHEIVAIGNVEPIEKKDEMDSYMYQTVGYQILSLLSAAMSLPIYRQRTKGIAVCKEKVYVATVGDEVEDLFMLLSKVKDEMQIDGVSVGAIESDYQRTRVENVCYRLNLRCFAFLWKRNQEELLQEMIDAGINAIVVKVATIGLKPEVHLGKGIKELKPVLLDLHKKFGIHICGEGGEYETLTIDCPFYRRKVEIIESEIIHSDDAFAPVGYLKIKNATLETKLLEEELPMTSKQARLEYIKNVVRPPIYYVQDCLDDVSNKILPDDEEEKSSDILPFPFVPRDVETESRVIRRESWMKKSDILSIASSDAGPSAKFSSSSILLVDKSVTHLNLSTGWCCVGNVTATNIRDGLILVRKHLERYQYQLRDVVSITLYLKDMGEWQKMNKMYSEMIPSVDPPTRACVAVPLAHDVSVAITVVAHRLVSKTQKVVHYTEHSVDRETIHVQSISHWAPATIASYSQCIRVGEILYVSGQIPLIPGSLELLERPILQQCQLTLRHIYRILTAMNESYTLANVLQGICFVTSEDIAAELSQHWTCLTKNEHAPIATVVVTSLPKSAPFEWQVMACGYSGPQVLSNSETLSEVLQLNYKRCQYAKHNTSSLVCNVNFLSHSTKNAKSMKNDVKNITAEDLMTVMKICLRILRGDIVGSPLCTFNVFFKASETALAEVVNETSKNFHDSKVVVSCIPVAACIEPSVLITITGISH